MPFDLLRLPGKLPLLVGHRGACAVAPENTLCSFAQAWADGADMVEMDLRLSADEHVVVFHDERVDRTTDGTGEVGALTLAELRRLDAGAWFDARFAGERIPTLAEVFDWARGKIALLLELKYPHYTFEPRLAQRVADLVSQHRMEEQIAFISYNVRGLQQIAALLPHVRTGPMPPLDRVLQFTAWLAHRLPALARIPQVRRILLRPLSFTQRVGGSMVSPNIAVVTPALVTASHAARIPLSCGGLEWDYPAAIRLDVDTLAANNPGEVYRHYLAPRSSTGKEQHHF
jgi:glycerophosphoryl diester phosphodiesterase